MSNRKIGVRAGQRRQLVAAASGLVSLLLGASVYLMDRDWGSVLFLAPFATWQPAVSGWFGSPGFNLPSFFHAYGFALLIALVLGDVRRAWLLGSTGWFGIAALLEALQSELVWSIFLTTEHNVGATAFGRAVEVYVVNGSFDIGDMLAAAVGCFAAGAVAYMMEVPT